jgi:hypothetical protein
VHALHAEGAGDPRGFDRIEVGEIARVDILDESDPDEWPEDPDIETRELRGEFTPPPRHADINYDDPDAVPPNDAVQVDPSRVYSARAAAGLTIRKWRKIKLEQIRNSLSTHGRERVYLGGQPR